MANALQVFVKESQQELIRLQKNNPLKIQKLSMLLALKKSGALSIEQLTAQTGSCAKSIQVWRKKYVEEGIEALLSDNRGGYKKPSVTPKAAKALSERLNNPKEGFRSFIEVRQWLSSEFGIEMNYHAVNKYVKRNYGARLKVSRKSHVLKNTADEAVFKKPIRKV